MTAPALSPTAPETTPGLVSAAAPRVPTAEIDASCRAPVLLLFICGLVWLLIGLGLMLLASIKLHAPAFLADSPWLTLGRIRPAGVNALLYGFACPTALGVLLWMLSRLSGQRLVFPGAAFIGALFWNLGVKLGVFGILIGASTGFEWLEMPRHASPILFCACALIGLAAVATFATRREKTLYVSTWYLLAALFWFPWIYSAANLLLVFWPVRGAVQVVVNAWFTGSLLGLWLGPVALAAIFYFLPKLLRRPLHDWWLAAYGFWTLAVFAPWTGVARLAGGPVPAWLPSLGIAATALLIVPLVCCGLNWHRTVCGAYAQAWAEPTLRFILFSAGACLVSGGLGILLAFRSVAVLTRFTYAETAVTWLAVLGFVGLALLGGVHDLVPRLTRLGWPSSRRARFHFWGSAAGVTLVFAALFVGGLVQGDKLNDPSVPFVAVSRATVPFVGLATLGWLTLLAAQVSLCCNLAVLLYRWAEPWRRATLELFAGAAARKAEARP